MMKLVLALVAVLALSCDAFVAPAGSALAKSAISSSVSPVMFSGGKRAAPKKAAPKKAAKKVVKKVAAKKAVKKVAVKKGAKVAANANPVTSRIDRAVKATFSENNWAFIAVGELINLGKNGGTNKNGQKQ